jgi:alcohol dehydrogenase class IV
MSHKVIDILQYHQKKQVLIVTDHGLMSLKLLDPLMNLLKQQQMIYHVYSDTQVNPTITNLEEAKTLYYRHHCDAIIGFGGGSSGGFGGGFGGGGFSGGGAGGSW